MIISLDRVKLGSMLSVTTCVPLLMNCSVKHLQSAYNLVDDREIGKLEPIDKPSTTREPLLVIDEYNSLLVN